METSILEATILPSRTRWNDVTASPAGQAILNSCAAILSAPASPAAQAILILHAAILSAAASPTVIFRDATFSSSTYCLYLMRTEGLVRQRQRFKTPTNLFSFLQRQPFAMCEQLFSNLGVRRSMYDLISDALRVRQPELATYGFLLKSGHVF